MYNYLLHFDLQTLQIKIQLILEQHGFELSRSTYMKIFFNKYTVGPLCSQVVHLWIQPTLDQNSVFYLRLGALECGGLTEVICGFSTAHGVGAPTHVVRGSAVLALVYQSVSSMCSFIVAHFGYP